MTRSLGAALIAATLFYSPFSFAVVDMKNANYSESWIDVTVPGSGMDFKIQRHYNSRSIFTGMFGYGWCSDYETTLERTPEGGLKLQECGAGQEITYQSAKADGKGIDVTVNQILEYARKVNRTATPQYFSELKAQLQENAGLRQRWAVEAKLRIPEAKKGSVYEASTLEVEKIAYDGTFFTRTMTDGTLQKFDNNGRLVYVYDKNGNYVKMVYNGDLLKELVDNNARKLSFAYANNKKVKEITGPNGIKAEYTFKGEDLTEVRNMWKNKYAYQYDDVHNLLRVDFPDKTFLALTYNKNNDWVTSFTERAVNGPACTESYTYEVDKKAPDDHYWSVAVKKCGKEVQNQARFEFWHKKRPDGKRYLNRVITKSNTDSLDVTYHADLGRPVQIKKNNFVTTFGYYPNGLIQWKSTEQQRLTFDYKNEFNKVSRVVTEYYDAYKKVNRKRETTFRYDGKANLVFASNSDGQTVALTYDLKGRIASITDQAKKEVRIQYEERTGKPATITRPNVGTIQVSYKPNGEIQKVDSKEGPTVAVQVAATFNNLLDIIAPATSELSL
jgi:YD repeat-containing protein